MKQTYDATGLQGKFDFWVTGTVSPMAATPSRQPNANTTSPLPVMTAIARQTL
jgi:hypothetical protein